MSIVFGIAVGLIIANKLVGIHNHCERCKIAVQEELKIIR